MTEDSEYKQSRWRLAPAGLYINQYLVAAIFFRP